MAGYTYRGTKPLQGPEEEAPKPEVQPCGTLAAYARHLYRKETACDACKRASRDAARARRALRGPGRRVARCGTAGGYQAHERRKETPCNDCKAAKSVDSRARYQRKKAAAARVSAHEPEEV